MQVAPAAQLDDGDLDVTIWSGFGLMDFIRKRQAPYDGSHLREPGAQVLRTRRTIATSESTGLMAKASEGCRRSWRCFPVQYGSKCSPHDPH